MFTRILGVTLGLVLAYWAVKAVTPGDFSPQIALEVLMAKLSS